MKRHLLTAAAFVALAACSPSGDPQKKEDAKTDAAPVSAPAEVAAPAPVKTDAPAGAYTLDKARQYGVPQRADFGTFVRKKGFCLD